MGCLHSQYHRNGRDMADHTHSHRNALNTHSTHRTPTGHPQDTPRDTHCTFRGNAHRTMAALHLAPYSSLSWQANPQRTFTVAPPAGGGGGGGSQAARGIVPQVVSASEPEPAVLATGLFPPAPSRDPFPVPAVGGLPAVAGPMLHAMRCGGVGRAPNGGGPRNNPSARVPPPPNNPAKTSGVGGWWWWEGRCPLEGLRGHWGGHLLGVEMGAALGGGEPVFSPQIKSKFHVIS